jgi:carbamoyltransferase
LRVLTLGINAGVGGHTHDASACLTDDAGRVLAFLEAERLSRRRHAFGETAAAAADACLRLAGVSACDVDVVAVGWDLPKVKAMVASRGPLQEAWQVPHHSELVRRLLGWDEVPLPDVVFVPHHLAHAVCSFYASPFPSAAVVVVDGSGEEESISVYEAHAGRHLVRRRWWPYSHSLGAMYEAAGALLGFGRMEAGKTMGLSSFGRDLQPWPLLSFRGDDFSPGIEAGRQNRPLCPELDSLDSDELAVRLAWSVQSALEEAILFLAGLARRATGLPAVCLSGGIALNCSANALVDEPLYVPPVPHDAGVALGAAWYVNPPRSRPAAGMSAYLGGEPGSPEAALAGKGGGPGGSWRLEPFSAPAVAERLVRGQVGAIAVGRSEAGPRALCHRSIVALPSSTEMRDRVNRIKGRERWRPLGPVAERARSAAYWEARDHLCDYMLAAVPVTEPARSRIPAVVHADGTTRPQVLGGGDPEHARMAAILRELEAAGLPPVLVNTSFNARGEPIVESARDALDAFGRLGLDFLVLEDALVLPRA